MPKATNYIRPENDHSDKCYVCGSTLKLQNLFHPSKILREGDKGSVITCCRPCYVYYRTKNLNWKNLDTVLEVLRSRKRYGSSEDRAITSFNLGLTFIRDAETDELLWIEEDEEIMDYSLEDAKKFLEHRAWLVRQSLEDVEQWAKDNLTDQRFIIKVVSSFSK